MHASSCRGLSRARRSRQRRVLLLEEPASFAIVEGEVAVPDDAAKLNLKARTGEGPWDSWEYSCLALLMFLAYRGINVLILAPLMSLLAVLFAGGLPILGTYTQIFMQALGDYVITFFPLFLLGAIFGS
jgi:hypothetical protein